MPPLDAPFIVVASGATIETSFLPQRLWLLREEYGLRVASALSPKALDFVTPLALRAVTHHPVYTESEPLDPSGTPLHLAYADADALVIFPATARVLAEAAVGSVTCPVTRLLAFGSPARTLIAPAVHPRMDRSVYRPHLDRLAGRGCTILGGDDLHASWRDVQDALVARFHLVRTPGNGSVRSLFP